MCSVINFLYQQMHWLMPETSFDHWIQSALDFLSLNLSSYTTFSIECAMCNQWKLNSSFESTSDVCIWLIFALLFSSCLSYDFFHQSNGFNWIFLFQFTKWIFLLLMCKCAYQKNERRFLLNIENLLLKGVWLNHHWRLMEVREFIFK